MLLPSLSGLRLGADAEAGAEAPKPELSADLITSVLAAIKDGEPDEACRAAASWCALNRAHRNACRDNADDVWRALIERVFPAKAIAELDNPKSPDNWFGEWPGYHSNSWGLRADAFDTPRAFFYALCHRAWRRRMTPLWSCMADHIRNVPRDFPNYFEIAKLAVGRVEPRSTGGQRAGRSVSPKPSRHGLSNIPTDMPRYDEIVRWAVQHPYRVYDNTVLSALRWVPTDRADYGELLRLAIEAGDTTVMNWVPTDRADYGELARIAIESGDPQVMNYVPADRADYGELARLAMKKASALKFVDTDNANYLKIAKYAIEQHRGAIENVPKTHPDYAALLEFQRAQWKNWKTGDARVRARRGGARTGEACA